MSLNIHTNSLTRRHASLLLRAPILLNQAMHNEKQAKGYHQKGGDNLGLGDVLLDGHDVMSSAASNVTVTYANASSRYMSIRSFAITHMIRST
jgi:hypothetical protein